MAKVTIAQLQEKINGLEVEKNNWYQKYRELKEAEEKRNQLKMARLDEERTQVDRQVANLMEVIRWQINNRTAEAPFMPMKNEREDNSKRNY